MWLLIKVLSIFAFILSIEASPTRYFSDSVESSPKIKAVEEERLSDNVIPDNYNLKLTLKNDFYQTQEFSGDVTISIKIKKDADLFSLYATDLDISSLTLKKGTENVDVTLENPTNNILIVTGNETLTEGDYSLNIVYTGKLSSTSMKGFYLSSYEDNTGTLKYLATTQFEEMDARRAFPSFDEPAFKATFDISIVHPASYTALSNTVGSASSGPISTTTTFKTTPPISTYLVAFIVSDLQCTTGPSTTSNIRPQVCARAEAKVSNSTNLALATAPLVLNEMATYTGFDYKEMNVNQLTQVAIPDFAPGAMENWGLVTYREADLLWDEAESSDSYKQSIVSVIAHELSHQWFGDLVTLNWWSDIFLNEGFATYFEYHITDILYKEWEFQKQFVVEQLQTALLADSLDTSLPLSYDTDDPETINNRFDDISYNKGGSILRMVHHLLGLEIFKAGLASYITDNAQGTSTPSILWKSLEAASAKSGVVMPEKVTFSEVMENWTKKPGYPLLTVTATDETSVTITQKQFLLSGEGKNTWYVPISYSLQLDDFSDTTTKEWLIPDKDLILSEVLKDKNWILLNNEQTGFYRVHYDETLLKKISSALKENVDNIDKISRSQLVDDQLNLARAGIKSYKSVFEFLQFLPSDTSYYTWYSAFSNFGYLLGRIPEGKAKTALKEYILTLMGKLTTTFDESKTDDQIYSLTQVLVQSWACKLGQTACLEKAAKLLKDYSTSGTRNFDKNLKGTVYCYGLRNSDNSTRDYTFLWSKYAETKLATERVTILRSLGCVNDRKLRNDFLDKVLTSDIRIQDARYVFSSVSSNGDDGITDFLEFLSSKSTELATRFGEDTSSLPYAISTVANSITLQAQINKLQTLSDKYGKERVTAAVTKAQTNLKTSNELQNTFEEFFDLTDTTTNSDATTDTDTTDTDTTNTDTTNTDTTNTDTTNTDTTNTDTTDADTTTDTYSTTDKNGGRASINILNSLIIVTGYLLLKLF